MPIRTIQGKQRHLSGWKRDRPDHRDLLMKTSFIQGLFIPKISDLRKASPVVLSKVEDQGDIGSCTANSSTSVFETLYLKANKPETNMSRLFLYYATRVWTEKTAPGDDSGCQIRNVMRTLAQYGVCFEKTWPYDVPRFLQEPPQQAKTEATQHTVIFYYRLPNLNSIKQCLVQGFPVVGGFSVPENMESDECAQTGVVKYPSPTEDFVGGHAVMFVGHNDDTSQLTFQNSWSSEWGDKGFGYLPYQFVTTGLATDFWTIRTAKL